MICPRIMDGADWTGVPTGSSLVRHAGPPEAAGMNFSDSPFMQ